MREILTLAIALSLLAGAPAQARLSFPRSQTGNPSLRAPGPAVVDYSLLKDEEIKQQLSEEFAKLQLAIENAKNARSTKTMSGRAWTALDDIVVGGSGLVVSSVAYGAFRYLPRMFPNAQYLHGQYATFSKFGVGISLIASAYLLAQGLLVYSMVPKILARLQGTFTNLLSIRAQVS